MSTTHFVAGDWGTSNFRLYLCSVEQDGSARLVDTRFGPGIRASNGDFEHRFFDLAQDWIEQHGKMPVILSGMVGSNIGWKEAPYLDCPVSADDIAAGRVAFDARGLEISILAGLRCQNPLHLPDVMRGEELQLLGWLEANQHGHHDARLFALPGTHNKWALVEGKRLQTFLTAFTGELFALLKDHSILIQTDSAVTLDEQHFLEGVETVLKLGDAHLLHSLFAIRSRQVVGEITAGEAHSYLSGQIIAADVVGALSLFTDVYPITVIGDPVLSAQYKIAFNQLGLEAACCDPDDIAIAGFEAIYRTLYPL